MFRMSKTIAQKIKRAEKEEGIIKDLRRGGLPETTITGDKAASAGRFSDLTPNKNNINDNDSNIKYFCY